MISLERLSANASDALNHDMNPSESNSDADSQEKAYRDMYKVVLKFAPNILKQIESKEVVDKFENLLVDPYQYFEDHQSDIDKPNS